MGSIVISMYIHDTSIPVLNTVKQQNRVITLHAMIQQEITEVLVLTPCKAKGSPSSPPEIYCQCMYVVCLLWFTVIHAFKLKLTWQLILDSVTPIPPPTPTPHTPPVWLQHFSPEDLHTCFINLHGPSMKTRTNHQFNINGSYNVLSKHTEGSKERYLLGQNTTCECSG